MTTTIGSTGSFGRVKVQNFERAEIPNLSDPKVVERIWRDARRVARAEARPFWVNAVLRWLTRK